MKLTLMSSTGTKLATCAWIAAVVLLFILGEDGVGPGDWVMHVQADSFGFVSRKLTLVALAFFASPVWFLTGALWDFITKQGQFEPDPEELRLEEKVEDRERTRKRKKRRRRDSDERHRDDY